MRAFEIDKKCKNRVTVLTGNSNTEESSVDTYSLVCSVRDSNVMDMMSKLENSIN